MAATVEIDCNGLDNYQLLCWHRPLAPGRRVPPPVGWCRRQNKKHVPSDSVVRRRWMPACIHWCLWWTCRRGNKSGEDKPNLVFYPKLRLIVIQNVLLKCFGEYIAPELAFHCIMYKWVWLHLIDTPQNIVTGHWLIWMTNIYLRQKYVYRQFRVWALQLCYFGPQYTCE